MSSYRKLSIRPQKQRQLRGGTSNAAGFTLIEIMIVVLIIGVLSSIAYASYDRSVINTRRTTAAACVQEGAQYMERFRTTEMSYAGATLPACSTEVTQYSVALTASDAATYTITATPKTGSRQASKDPCGALTLDQLGTRRSASGDATSCW